MFLEYTARIACNISNDISAGRTLYNASFLVEYLPQNIFSSHCISLQLIMLWKIRVSAVSWELIIGFTCMVLLGVFSVLNNMAPIHVFYRCTSSILIHWQHPTTFHQKMTMFLVPRSLLKTMQSQVSVQSLGNLPFC